MTQSPPQSATQPATHSATQSSVGDAAKTAAGPGERLTTYYDGGCPLCSKEIAHYRRVDRNQRVRWVDLTEAADELAAIGLDTSTAMRRLHVQEADGRLLSGVPAFVAIWRRLPGYRVLARVVEALGLIRPLEWGYARFADWRFRRRCDDGACGVGGRDSG
ncbi:MAG: DUF393 domain-containing protein [Thiohalocapsa sp.]